MLMKNDSITVQKVLFDLSLHLLFTCDDSSILLQWIVMKNWYSHLKIVELVIISSLTDSVKGTKFETIKLFITFLMSDRKLHSTTLSHI